MKKKIFIGGYNIASQFSDWEKGFKSIGFEVIKGLNIKDTHLTETDNAIKLFKWDFINLGVKIIELPRWWQNFMRRRMLRKIIPDCEYYFFIWTSINKDFSDLKWLKTMNKKVVVLFVGSDVREYHAMKQNMEMHGMSPIDHGENYDYSIKGSKDRLNRIRMFEKYADVILSLPNQSVLALRPYHRANFMIDVSGIEHHPNQREIPKVLHAASNSAFKGTDIVRGVLKELKDEGVPFDYELFSGVPYSQVFQKYYDADILVGQLFAPSGGKQERELLACGKVVLTHMAYHYEDNIGDDCPIIDVNKDNLKEKLKNIILNYNKRKELALKGRAYVESKSDPKRICLDIIKLLESDSKSFDFNPSFFREHFISPSPNHTKLFNTYNKKVQNEDWYKEFVDKGERDGLNF